MKLDLHIHQFEMGRLYWDTGVSGNLATLSGKLTFSFVFTTTLAKNPAFKKIKMKV